MTQTTRVWADPGGDGTVLWLLVLLLALLATAGAIVVSKFLFLLLFVALIVFAVNAMRVTA